jgi:hypothetical protein
MTEPTQLDVLDAIYGKRDFYRSDEIANARAVIALYRASAAAPIQCASSVTFPTGAKLQCDRNDGHAEFHGARGYQWAD